MTGAELDDLRAALLARRSRGAAPHRAGWPAGWEDLHARNTRIHGEARAELARWTALLRVSEYLYRVSYRRRERALLVALEALEAAQAAERDEATWLRLGVWVARRVDEAAARVARRCRLTSFDFFTRQQQGHGAADDALEPTDVETDEIDW